MWTLPICELHARQCRSNSCVDVPLFHQRRRNVQYNIIAAAVFSSSAGIGSRRSSFSLPDPQPTNAMLIRCTTPALTTSLNEKRVMINCTLHHLTWIKMPASTRQMTQEYEGKHTGMRKVIENSEYLKIHLADLQHFAAVRR